MQLFNICLLLFLIIRVTLFFRNSFLFFVRAHLFVGLHGHLRDYFLILNFIITVVSLPDVVNERLVDFGAMSGEIIS